MGRAVNRVRAIRIKSATIMANARALAPEKETAVASATRATREMCARSVLQDITSLTETRRLCCVPRAMRRATDLAEAPGRKTARSVLAAGT